MSIYIDGSDFIGRIEELCGRVRKPVQMDEELERLRIEDMQRACGTRDYDQADQPEEI